MPRIEIPFTGASKQHRSLNVAAQVCRNWYPEIITDDQGKEMMRVLIGTPGLDLKAAISGAMTRGLHMTSNALKFWCVMGNKFYEVDPNFNATPKGTLGTSQGPVYMADNGTHILIVDGSATGYSYNIAAGTFVADIAAVDADFVGGDDVVFIDGYFFVIQPGTDIVQSVDAPYGTDPGTAIWVATEGYSMKGDPDNTIALDSLHQQLWVLGDFSTQVFRNSAEPSGFPFTQVEGAVLNIGIGARATLKELDGSLFWLAKTKNGDRFIVRTQGYQPVRISDHALEYELGQLSTVGDAYAYTYIEEGHSFYVLTCPTADWTRVYDAATGEWHERKSYGMGRHRSFGHIFFNGMHITGDHTTGSLYQMKMDKYDDNGAVIERRRRSQHLKRSLSPVEIPKLVIDIESGVGLVAGQGSDPQMMLRCSPDGGHTWGNEMTASIGKIGEYGRRVEFPRLGTADDWIFEISITDPVKCTVLGAYVGDD